VSGQDTQKGVTPFSLSLTQLILRGAHRFRVLARGHGIYALKRTQLNFLLFIGRMSEARKELHRLLEHPGLSTTPVLVLANKIDLQPHVVRCLLFCSDVGAVFVGLTVVLASQSEVELIKELNLDYIVDNPYV